MIEKLTNNWIWKVLSLFLAFVLWVVVVNYNDPYITKSFEDIQVEKRYEDAITSQEKAITYLEGETVDVVVGGNRSRIDKLGIEEISAYVDMKLVSITGAIDIEVDAPDQIDLLEKTPNDMQISWEQIETVVKDVQVFYDGELASEHIKLNPVVTPNQVELTGPESKLAMVASVLVNVKINEATDDITVFVSPKIQDSDGNDIPNLTLNNNQIEVKVPIEKIREIPVSFSTVGSISADYRLMDIGLDVDRVMVRGESEIIDDYSELIVSNIDMTTLTSENKSLSINLSQYLPEGVWLYGSETIAYLNMDIEAIMSIDKVITASDITVKSLGDQMQFKFVEEFEIPLTVQGIQRDLNDLGVEDLLPSISLKDLEAGEHEVELKLTVDSDLSITTEIPMILVELSEVPEGEETTEEGATETTISE